MKDSKNKGRTSLADEPDAVFEKTVNELADAVVEGLKDQHYSDLEPFDLYAQRVRSKIHDNAVTFRKRFARGYHILLEELAKMPPAKPQVKQDHNPDKPPPGAIMP